jgi:uroporphyrinogen decarboxylase
MTSRDRIRTIIGGAPADRCGFWLGNPHPSSLPALYAYFGTSTLEQLHLKLGSDLRWLSPQMTATVYRHPEGKGLFDIGHHKRSHAEPGPLSTCTSLREVENYEWPDPGYLDFSECLAELSAAGTHYRASGFWMPFFHDVIDLLGFEPLMLRLHDQPDIVNAVCERVCGFYLEANERFFAKAAGKVDATFFGNDFGTQRDLLISEKHFDEFFLPWILRFAEQGRRHGLQVMMHSCGSVHRLIGRLIDAGVQCLHPLQARAPGMDAVSLVREFGGRTAFLGGIDTQELLVRGTPGDIREEVRRLKGTFGPGWIASPSHEALLPDIPPQNVAAMAAAALEP